MSFGAFSRRAFGAGGFDPSGLTPILIYDHVGLASNQWVPSLDTYGMGTLTGGAGTVTSNWGGSGKPIVNYGGGRVQRNVIYNRQARTWAFVGTIPASPANGSGIASSASGANKIYPMYWGTGSSGTLGCDFTQGTSNRALFAGLNTYVGAPFVLTVSAIGVSEFRGHLLIGGTSQAGVNTTTVSNVYELRDGFCIGGWHTTGGSWGGGVAAVAAYQSAVASGATGAAQLSALASYWAAQYPGVSF